MECTWTNNIVLENFTIFFILYYICYFTYIFIPDRMTESFKEEPDMKEIDKNEEISIQEEILPSSTVEDTCTVYLQEEDVGMDATEIKGKQWRNPIIYSFIMNIYLSLNKDLFEDSLLGALHNIIN